MVLIADVLMIAGVFAAAFYCATLAHRLRGLTKLDSGLGAAIGTLSQQVDEMQVSLTTAKNISGANARELVDMTARAEMAAGRLELLLATLHERDVEPPTPRKPAARKAAPRKPGGAKLAPMRKRKA